MDYRIRSMNKFLFVPQLELQLHLKIYDSVLHHPVNQFSIKSTAAANNTS